MSIISKKNEYFRFPIWCKTPSDNFTLCQSCSKGKDNCDMQMGFQIIEDCRGFYYTYNLLQEESLHPIFVRSHDEFQRKIEKAMDRIGQPFLFYAIVTNGALAVELAIKFLLYRQHHQFKQIHKLDTLFEALHVQDKEELFRRMKSETGHDAKMIRKMLTIFSNAFEQARYYFSNDIGGISMFFSDFVRIVCEYAFELFRQDWIESPDPDVIVE